MSEELFNKIVLAWIFLGIIVFVINMKIVVPYGRHVTKKWGPLINNRLAWVAMECPVLLLVLYFVLPGITLQSVVVWLLLFLFIAHYFHRTFIFPFKIRGVSKKIPLSVMILAIIFNLFNGFFIGYYLGNFADYELTWFYSLPFILGLILFAIGAFINWKADLMLISLRDNGDSSYKIPRGFLFEKISCPNHFGEMIEWSGYALMSFNLPALSFAVWTLANLIPRALAHHRWYGAHFKDYPENRKAFLPGIW
jgi:3-oxo-5-alpha-steroid 4-dehydrogenase 1